MPNLRALQPLEYLALGVGERFGVDGFTGLFELTLALKLTTDGGAGTPAPPCAPELALPRRRRSGSRIFAAQRYLVGIGERTEQAFAFVAAITDRHQPVADRSAQLLLRLPLPLSGRRRPPARDW